MAHVAAVKGKNRQYLIKRQSSRVVSKEEPLSNARWKADARSLDSHVGSDFSSTTFEHHAALLGDPLLSQRMHDQDRAAIAQRLQSDYGNTYVQRLVEHIKGKNVRGIQTNLKVGAAGDRYEQEADRVSRDVVKGLGSPESQRDSGLPANQDMLEHVQRRMQTQRDNELVRRRAALETPEVGLEGGEVSPDLSSSIDSARGGGQALSGEVRTQMENSFGADFGDVRIHADSNADSLSSSLSAKAFTTGNDIFFAKGEYSPDSRDGQETLAHELTHVVQQTDGMPAQRSVVQRLAITDDPIDWTKPNTLTRSGSGTFGAYFVKQGSDLLVVKPEMDPGTEIAAQKLLGPIGIETPQTKSFKKDTGPYKSISAMFERLKDQLSDKHRNQLTEQVTQFAPYYIVMGAVEGTDLKSLDEDQLIEVLCSKEVLNQIGKLMVADAFMGNSDRLLGAKTNLGNIMLSTDPNKSGVIGIDNEVGFNAQNLAYDKDKVKALMTYSGAERYMDQFLAALKRVYQDLGVEDKIDIRGEKNIKSDLWQGMEAGWVELVQVFKSNRDLLDTLADVNEEFGEHDTRRSEDAANKLAGYIEYRLKRNKKPKGLKWTTKLNYLVTGH